MRMIVCGSRDFTDYLRLESVLKQYLDENGIAPTEVEIVSGHCQGADLLGELFAKKYGCALTVFRAEWGKYGNAAGPIRNRQMVEYLAKATENLVVAFVHDKSRGTRHTVSLARDKNIPVIEHFYMG